LVTLEGLPGNFAEEVKGSFHVVIADERAHLVPNLLQLLHVGIKDTVGDVDAEITEISKGEFQVSFTPLHEGDLNVVVQLEGQDINGNIIMRYH
jgi:hypothetical protein